MSQNDFPQWLRSLDPAPAQWGGCTVWRARLPLWRLRGNTGQISGVPANPRRWSGAQLDSLRQSLRDTPPAKLKEIVLKDNGTFGDWDVPALLEDYPEFDLAACGIAVESGDSGTEAEPSEDDFSQAVVDTAPPVTEPGDLFALGEHLLMCGDATSGEAIGFLAKSGPVDLLMTDPPYNVDYEGGTAAKLKIMNDRMDDTVFIEFLAAAFKAADSVMRKGAAFYLWHASSKAFCVHSAYRDTGTGGAPSGTVQRRCKHDRGQRGKAQRLRGSSDYEARPAYRAAGAQQHAQGRKGFGPFRRIGIHTDSLRAAGAQVPDDGAGPALLRCDNNPLGAAHGPQGGKNELIWKRINRNA